jgi:hypothetical protein
MDEAREMAWPPCGQLSPIPVHYLFADAMIQLDGRFLPTAPGQSLKRMAQATRA